DRTDYQTLFARDEGAVAAPTAGLHFTERLMQALDARGISSHFVTLHVGPGTFLPVRAADTESHVMHPERGMVSAETAEALNQGRRGEERSSSSARLPCGFWRARLPITASSRRLPVRRASSSPQAVDSA